MPFDPDELVRLLTPHCMDSDAQQAFILGALGKEHPLIPQIHFDKSPATFILNMAQRVETYDPVLIDRLITYAKAGGAKPKPRLFLSYARADDEPFVRQLYDDLRDAGFDPWFDREKMPSRGLTFTTEIAYAIDGAERLILVVGPGALQSEYVRAEWEYALSTCKVVIPILRLGEVDALPETLRKLHTPDFRETRPYPEAFEELRRILKDSPPLLGDLKGVEPLPAWYLERPADLKAMVNAICTDGLTGAKAPMDTSKQQTLSLTGIGGIGKTTLARALCHRCEVRYQFPHGIVWLEVGKSADAASLLGRAGELLGDQRSEYQKEADAKARLAFWTSGKTALFVLDDVWDHQIAEAFKGVGKTCRLVVTTRQPQIVNKLGAASQAVDRLTEDEGIRLIDKHLGRTPDTPHPHDSTERAIVRLLEGHTLSVHIAAARLKERGANFAPTLLSRLQNPDRLFKDLKMDETNKNHNLEVSLAESYTDLKSDGQQRFRALGVFAPEGTFDLEALKAVWADKDEADTDDGIDVLTRAGLLVRLEDGRYRLHNLLRAYARALAGEKGELEETARRHFTHYEESWGDYDRNSDEDSHPRIQTEWLNIREALAWAFTHEPRRAADWVWALNYYMQMRESFAERRAVLEGGKSAAERSGYARGQANTLKALGDLERMEDNYPLARERYTAALSLFEAIPARLGQANTLTSLGDMYNGQEEWVSAVPFYEKALALYTAIPDRHGMANVLVDLGLAHFELGEQDSGIAEVEEAARLFNATHDSRWAANAQRRAAQLRSRKEGKAVDESAPNAMLQQLFQAFMAVQSSDQMAGLVAQLPPELLDVLEQIVEGIIAQYPPDQTEGVHQRLDDLRKLRGQ